MRLVNDKPRIVTSAEGLDLGKRSSVAPHAKDSLCQNHSSARSLGTLQSVFSLECFVFGDPVGPVAVFEWRSRTRYEDVVGRPGRSVSRKVNGQIGEFRAARPNPSPRQRTALGSKGVGGEYFAAGSNVGPVYFRYAFGGMKKGRRRPEGKWASDAKTLQFRSEAAIEQKRRTARKSRLEGI